MVLHVLLLAVAFAAVVFSLVRPRDGRESVARLERPSASRAPAPLERSRRTR
jgi:uncharacterized membrane protein YccC